MRGSIVNANLVEGAFPENRVKISRKIKEENIYYDYE